MPKQACCSVDAMSSKPPFAVTAKYWRSTSRPKGSNAVSARPDLSAAATAFLVSASRTTATFASGSGQSTKSFSVAFREDHRALHPLVRGARLGRLGGLDRRRCWRRWGVVSLWAGATSRPRGGTVAAEDESVAPLVEAGDVGLLGEAELHPGRHLVALDERVDLLRTLALRERKHEHALRVRWARAEVDDAHRLGPPIDEQAERHRLVLEEDLLDRLLLGTPRLRRH